MRDQSLRQVVSLHPQSGRPERAQLRFIFFFLFNPGLRPMNGATHLEGGSSCLNKLGLRMHSQVGPERGDSASFQTDNINRYTSSRCQLDT